MWTSQKTIETAAPASVIFEMFRDVARWPEWNAGVEKMELDGPFVAGTTGRMTMPGAPPMETKLVWVGDGHGFEDETPIPDAGVTVRVRHEIVPAVGRTLIVYTTTVDGSATDDVCAEIGSMVTSDFPAVLAALAARAEARARVTP